MTNEEKLAEIDAIKAESFRLLLKSELDLQTAKFLNAEAERLMKQMDEKFRTTEEVETDLASLHAIIKKLELEQRMSSQDDAKNGRVKKTVEGNMNDEESADILIHSAEWYAKQATELIKEYKSCRTEHARQRLMPKLKHIYFKLGFERRGLAVIIGDNEGEEWKNE